MASDLLEYAARHQSRDAAAAVAPVLFRAAPGGLHKAASGFPGATGKPFGRDLDGFERGADFVAQMLEPEPRPLLSRRAEKFKRMRLFRRLLVHRPWPYASADCEVNGLARPDHMTGRHFCVELPKLAPLDNREARCKNHRQDPIQAARNPAPLCRARH